MLYIAIFRNMTLLNEDFLYSIIYARLAKNDTAPLFTLIHFVFHVYVARAIRNAMCSNAASTFSSISGIRIIKTVILYKT